MPSSGVSLPPVRSARLPTNRLDRAPYSPRTFGPRGTIPSWTRTRELTEENEALARENERLRQKLAKSESKRKKAAAAAPARSGLSWSPRTQLIQPFELHYFDFDGGRGPICRIPLHASGVAWKDVRLSGAEFGKAKEAGLYQTGLPILKLPSGRTITQSVAIARFAARLGDSGLYPSDPERALIVDELMDAAQDAFSQAPTAPKTDAGEVDEAAKKKLREEYAAGRLKAFMHLFAESLAANGGPYVSGPTLTIADLMVDSVVGMIASGQFDYIPASYLEQWPALVAANGLVKQAEVVKAYYAASE